MERQTPRDWPSSHKTQCDWLKGSHVIRARVVLLPSETDYSCCEFGAPKYPLLQTNSGISWKTPDYVFDSIVSSRRSSSPLKHAVKVGLEILGKPICCKTSVSRRLVIKTSASSWKSSLIDDGRFFFLPRHMDNL